MPETTEGQRAAEAEASVTVAEDAVVPGSVTGGAKAKQLNSKPPRLFPLSLLRVGRTSHVPFGAYAQVQELSGAEVFVGSCNEFRVAVVFEQGPVWSKDANELSGAALWIPDIEFQVDWDSFSIFDHIDDKLGALGIQDGNVFIAAAPPSKVGYVPVHVGRADATEGATSYGFTSWRAVARREDETFTLFEWGMASP